MIEPSDDRVLVDLSDLEQIDGASIAALARFLRALGAPRVEIRCAAAVQTQLQVAGCSARLVDVENAEPEGFKCGEFHVRT